MAIGNFVLGIVFAALLIVLRRWELDLRRDLALSEKVQKYSRYIYLARHTVIWLTVAQTIAIMRLI